MFGGGTSTGGTGLFGGNQQQPTQGTGLFGGSTGQTGGLFGKPPTQTGTGFGGSLFGGQQQQQQQQPQAPGLFGSQQQNAQTGSSLFGSTQQQPQQSQHLVASLTENPYGNAPLFQGLSTPSQSLGPLATPVASSQKTKKQAIIPHYRMMPHASSRLITPQRRPQGYGFSYSNLSTPLSASATSPLGINNSMLGTSSLGRSLGKSLSTSNLRNSYAGGESILAPGAFSNVTRGGTGSMKKLNINRSLTARRSLFGNDAPTTSSPLAKKVSFESAPSANGSSPQPSSSNALVPVETTEPSPATNGTTGKELAPVPEISEPSSEIASLERDNRKKALAKIDQTPGPYSMKPSIDKIKAMSREDRSSIRGLVVKREGCGQVEFSQVDLNSIPLEMIMGTIVDLGVRFATVYGSRSDEKGIHTPPRGTGLNVPARITLYNSWPKTRPGRLKASRSSSQSVEQHVKHLRNVKDTSFISYDPDMGQWVFEVQHFTTYGLDYDEDEDESMAVDEQEDITSQFQESSGNSALNGQNSPIAHEDRSSYSSQSHSVDDTFDFMKGKRQSHLPGRFDDVGMDFEVVGNPVDDLQSSVDLELQDEIQQEMEIGPDTTSMLQEQRPETPEAEEPMYPALELEVPNFTPRIDKVVLGANWTEQLMQTASPKKRDRRALRQQEDQLIPGLPPPEINIQKEKTATFGSTIDIMKSLFGPQDFGMTGKAMKVR